MRKSFSRIASSEIFSWLAASLIAKSSLITAPFVNVSNTACLMCGLGHSSRQVSVVLTLQILSSSSLAAVSTFYRLDPHSDIGGTILELDAVCLAAGEKFHRVLV